MASRVGGAGTILAWPDYMTRHLLRSTLPLLAIMAACAEKESSEREQATEEALVTKGRKLMPTSLTGGDATFADPGEEQHLDELESDFSRRLWALYPNDAAVRECYRDSILVAKNMRIMQCVSRDLYSRSLVSFGFVHNARTASWQQADVFLPVRAWRVSPTGMVTIVAMGGASGHVLGLDPKDGSIAWDHQLPSSDRPIMFSDGSMLFRAINPQPQTPALVLLSDKGEVLFQSAAIEDRGRFFENPCEGGSYEYECRRQVGTLKTLTIVPTAEVDAQRQ